MRRLIIMLAVTGLINTTAGCCLTAGVCDCDYGHGGCAAGPVVVPGAITPKPEPIREMPKPVDGAKPDK